MTAEQQKILNLVRHWVVPAIGCTEPICVALATAKATSLLGQKPTHIKASLSANIIKNAMGVGIPGTGMVGLPIAIALGALCGEADYGLEVLRNVGPADVEAAKQYVEEGRITIELCHDTREKLYAAVSTTTDDGHTATAILAREHTNFIHLERDTLTIAHRELEPQADGTCCDHGVCLSLKKVYDFATTMPLADIEFINEARDLNETAAWDALEGNYGHSLGKTLMRPLGRGIMGDTIFSRILASTSCACDARMAGAMIPVMSNSGSGNQGICATNPVVVFAQENHNTDEELTRALMLSHLTAIYIKQHLGTLSALCGCVVASTGAAMGITYLMGGRYKEMTYAVKNMIANLTGMICDGAKPSCTLKLTSGVTTAVLSAILAMQGESVSSAEGIIDDDVDQCIANLVSIGADAMTETDRKVLQIMTSKT